jgi:hypothetical protein
MNMPATQLNSGRGPHGAKCLWIAGFAILGSSVYLLSNNGTADSKEPAVRVTVRPDAAPILTAAVLGADDKPAAGMGTFTGVVTLKDKAPARKVLHKKGANVKDAPICAANDLLSDEFIVNEKEGNAVANVVIYLKKAPDGYKAGPVPMEPAVFDQMDCRFTPHILPVRLNQVVLLKSGDPTPHNTHITPIRNDGFNQLIQPNDRVGVQYKYTKPETLPTKVVCDLHDWMRAYHVVTDHPFIAVTNDKGEFTIKDLPPGKHMFTVWHEIPGYVKSLNNKLEVVIKADEVNKQALSFVAKDFEAKN